jgi:predicted transcriptional regulator
MLKEAKRMDYIGERFRERRKKLAIFCEILEETDENGLHVKYLVKCAVLGEVLRDPERMSDI